MLSRATTTTIAGFAPHDRFTSLSNGKNKKDGELYCNIMLEKIIAPIPNGVLDLTSQRSTIAIARYLLSAYGYSISLYITSLLGGRYLVWKAKEMFKIADGLSDNVTIKFWQKHGNDTRMH